MFRFTRPSVALACTAVCAVIPGSRGDAQIALSPPPDGARTHAVESGARYRAGGLTSFLFGKYYRDLWAATVEVPVLNLDGVGGGLTPTRTGGFGQSVSLHFDGNDGRRYVVRSVDKDPTKRLLPQLKGTFVASVVQDQISALHPSAALVVDPLLDATAVLHASHTLVVVPDDPRLGEFREEFAGMLGMLLLHPEDGADNTAGFAGSFRISSTESFFERLERNPCDRIDAPRFLKARFLDFIVGDKDRHAGQWRWASFPEGDCNRWEPIPEDRDQAFIDFDGFIMWLTRRARPQQIRFGPDYPSIDGLTFNGWEVDRRLLVGLDRAVWDSIVGVVQRELTDGVIESAVRRMPAEHFALSGARIETALKHRRDRLGVAASDYYDLITERPELNATDQDELAEFEHHANGDLTVRLSLADPDDDEPQGVYFERRFRADETTEVRVYLRGGDDAAVVWGDRGRVLVRVIGGGGDDRFENQSSAGGGKTRFYDSRGDNEFVRGVGARISETDYDRPPADDQAHQFALDWGKRSLLLPMGTYGPDLGVYLGASGTIERLGFRKDPFQSQHHFSVGLAAGPIEPVISYGGRFTGLIGRLDGLMDLEFSGLDIIQYHGLGNETIGSGASSFFDVRRRQLAVRPALEIAPSDHIAVGFGPSLEFANTSRERNAGRLIAMDMPYGDGSFGQIGGFAYAEVDTRDNPGAAQQGIHLAVEGRYIPELWDVRSGFGSVRGELSTFLTASIPTHPTLALRGGGAKVWGDYPFHEAAYLGGAKNLRGYREQRFAGDASVFGNAELRLGLVDFSVLVPAEFGVFGAADAGRVYYELDPAAADTWHTALGGGIWLSFVERVQTLSAGVMSGEDLTGVYVRAGFHF